MVMWEIHGRVKNQKLPAGEDTNGDRKKGYVCQEKRGTRTAPVAAGVMAHDRVSPSRAPIWAPMHEINAGSDLTINQRNASSRIFVQISHSIVSSRIFVRDLAFLCMISFLSKQSRIVLASFSHPSYVSILPISNARSQKIRENSNVSNEKSEFDYFDKRATTTTIKRTSNKLLAWSGTTRKKIINNEKDTEHE